MGDMREAADAYFRAGLMLYAQGDPPSLNKAKKIFMLGVSRYVQATHPESLEQTEFDLKEVPNVDQALGEQALMQGQLDEAMDRLVWAGRLFWLTGDLKRQAEAMERLGAVHMARGLPDEAMEAYGMAIRNYRGLLLLNDAWKAHLAAANAMRRLAGAYAATGDMETSARYLTMAEDMSALMGARGLAWQGVNWGRVQERGGLTGAQSSQIGGREILARLRTASASDTEAHDLTLWEFIGWLKENLSGYSEEDILSGLTGPEALGFWKTTIEPLLGTPPVLSGIRDTLLRVANLAVEGEGENPKSPVYPWMDEPEGPSGADIVFH
ncbi:MAG: tetratricopeptide repeat protein [Deltaproteobacteria bacterium]|nr:tetratricopeptide repeat protein [Deltaproteobacteria bacterium]